MGATRTFGSFFKKEFSTIQKVAIERVKDLQTQYISMGRDANGALKAIKIRPLTLDMQDLFDNAEEQIGVTLYNKEEAEIISQYLNFFDNTFEGDMKAFIKDFSTNKSSDVELTAKAMEYFRGIYNYMEKNAEQVDKNIKSQYAEADDFILKTHPKDTIVFTPDMMIGGTNLFGGQQNSMSETKNTNDINLNVTLTSNGVDLNQMTKREVLEPLVAYMQQILQADGLLNKNGSTPNPIVNYQYS
jgi:hypothetical protein